MNETKRGLGPALAGFFGIGPPNEVPPDTYPNLTLNRMGLSCGHESELVLLRQVAEAAEEHRREEHRDAYLAGGAVSREPGIDDAITALAEWKARR